MGECTWQEFRDMHAPTNIRASDISAYLMMVPMEVVKIYPRTVLNTRLGRRWFRTTSAMLSLGVLTCALFIVTFSGAIQTKQEIEGRGTLIHPSAPLVFATCAIVFVDLWVVMHGTNRDIFIRTMLSFDPWIIIVSAVRQSL